MWARKFLLRVGIVGAITGLSLNGATTEAGPFEFAAYATSTACGAITASGSVYTDSYDSNQGSYSKTKQSSEGNLGVSGNATLSGSVTVNGAIFTPHPTEGVCRNGAPGITSSGKVTTTKGYLLLSPLPVFSTPAQVTPGSQNITSTSNTTLKPGSYGNIVLIGRTTLTLSPGNYIFNALTMSGQTILTVSPAGQVVITFAGTNGVSPLVMSGGSIDNPSGIPLNLQLIYGGTSSITLSGGSNSHAVVYAPRAAVVLSGGSDWYGAMVVGSLTDSGNVALHYDRSLADKPTITGLASPAADPAGWNDTGVTVSFACADPISSIVSCTSPVQVTTQGANQAVTGTAVDQAGVTAATSVLVNIDETPPLIAGASAPLANSAGWNNSNLTVSFSCSDALSGVASCPGQGVVSLEGAGQPVSGTALDKAGNSATATVVVNVDKTPPRITAAVSPAPDAAGWNNSNVTVTFTCSDSLSGIATCPAPVQVTSQGANQILSGTSADKAGNTASVSVTLNIDKTAPTITSTVAPPPNDAGWNNSPVTVTFTCSDALSGIGFCPAPVTANAQGAAQPISGTATDKAGDSATATATVNLDEAPPTLTITSPTTGAIVNPGSLTITGTATDALSGVATVTCASAPAILSGSNFACTVSISAGANSFVIQALDQAGNVTQSILSIQGGIPAILSISPTSGQQGQANLTVTVTGQNTHFMQGMTVASFGAGITVTSVTVSSATTATILISIDSAATVDARTVTVTTGTEVATLPASFTVLLNQPPVITSQPPTGPVWENLPSIGPAPPGRDVGLSPSVYDDANDRLIFFSGDWRPEPPPADVWVLTNASGRNGTPAWIQLMPDSPGPGGRESASLTYVKESNRLIVCGGNTGLGDCWVLTNANGLGGSPVWIQLPSMPNAIFGSAAYDPITRRLMMFGFVNATTNQYLVLSDADGVGTPTWSQPTVTGTPPLVSGASIAYDPATNRLILFGGIYRPTPPDATSFNDVWILTNANGNGGISQWIKLSPSGQPPAGRDSAAFSYDPQTNSAILFGGRTLTIFDGDGNDARNDAFSDLWQLNNANGTSTPQWVELNSTGRKPIGHFSSAFGRDSVNQILPMALGRFEESATYASALLYTDNWILHPSVVGAAIGNAFTYGVVAVDPDGSTLSFSLTQSPVGMSISPTTGLISFVPTVAQIGIQPVTVRVDNGGGLSTSQSFQVLVVPAVATTSPSVVSVIPSVGQAGTAVDITVTAQNSNFVPDQTSAFFYAGTSSPEPYASGVTVLNTSTAVVHLIIPANVPTGIWNFNIGDGFEIARAVGAFTVQSTPVSPAITAVTPNSGYQGQQSVSVTITGQNTHFSQGTTVASVGAGITIQSLTVNSATSATAVLNIDPVAGLGARDLSITTGSEVVSLPASFTVLPNQPPVITSQPPTGPVWENPPSIGPAPAGRDVGFSPSVYDDVNDRLIFFSGDYSVAAAGYPADVWVLADASGLTGTPTWTQLAPSVPGPLGTQYASLTYVKASNRLIVCGGTRIPNQCWVLTNANGVGGSPTWIQLPDMPNAPFGSAAYDSSTNRLMMVGFTSATSSEFMILSNADGTEIGAPIWSQPTVVGTPPSGNFYETVAYDPNTNRLIYWGGDYRPTPPNLNYPNELWVLTNANGTGGAPQWTELSPKGGPPAGREGPVFSYDPQSNTAILFGGTTQNLFGTDGSNHADTSFTDLWQLSNANGVQTPQWTQLSTPGKMPLGHYLSVFGRDSVHQILPMALGRWLQDGPQGSPDFDSELYFADNWRLDLGVVRAVVGANFAYSVVASDSDGSSPNYSLTQSPPGMVISPASGVVTYVPTAAQIGIQAVTVRVDNGRGLSATQTFQVVVVAAATTTSPTMLSVVPAVGQIGTAVDVTVICQNSSFVAGQTSAMLYYNGSGGPPETYPQTVTVLSPTTVVVHLTIPTSAPTGSWNLNVGDGFEIAEGFGIFTVQSTPVSPAITAVTPNSGQQGQQNLSIVITGQNTHFSQGTTTASFGAGITVSSVIVASVTSATVTVNIPSGTPTGGRTITVQTGPEIVSLENGFTIQPGVISVAAGPAVTVLLPATAALNGSVMGPSGDSFSMVWSQVSGPAQATLSNAAALSTVVSFPTFSSSGTYVFQLTATDGTLTGSASVTITVEFCASGKETGIRSGETNYQSAVLSLPDGRLRRYTARYADPTYPLLSLISDDGLNWSQEAGIRLTPPAPIGTSSILQLSDGTFRLYYQWQDGDYDWRIYSAQSRDGLNWTNDPGIRIDTGGPANCPLVNAPDVVRFPNGLLRMYYNCEQPVQPFATQIVSATSTDGLTWTPEAGVRIASGYQPDVLQLSDGTYRMFYALSVYEPPDNLSWIVSAVSQDGLSWSVEPGIRLNRGAHTSPDGRQAQGTRIVPLADGTFRIYYSGDDYNLYQADFSAHWCSIGPSNPPSLVAGDDQTITLPSDTVALVATESDDKLLGTTVMYNWSLVSGPAAVLFVSPSTLSTNVQFSTPGQYRLRITAFDSVLYGYDDVNVTVLSPTSPALLSISPRTAQVGQSGITVALMGQATHLLAGTTEVDFGPGITASSVSVTSGTQLTAQLSISPTAILGSHDVTATTGGEVVSLPNAFILEPNENLPAILNISPAVGTAGQQNLSVTMSGQDTHFAQGTTSLTFGPDITVNSVAVATATSLTATITIPTTANLGAHDVSVTTGAEIAPLPGGFVVSAAGGSPSLTSISPNYGPQGLSGPVAIVGVDTHFVQGTTTVDVGAGITVSSVVVSCPVCLTATLAVDSAASPGPRTVTVTTGNEVATLPNGFTVTAVVSTPILTSITPNNVQQGQTVSVAITGSLTHFAQGSTQVNFGAGVTVSNVTVNNTGSLIAQIMVDPAAPLTTRVVTVTTGTEVVSSPSVFSVIAPTPVLYTLAPGGGTQGQQNLSVAISGLATHFVQGTSVANFGTGVTAISLTVASPTAATAVINIDGAAPPGARTVVVTTGSETASFINGFIVSVLSSQPIIYTLDPGGSSQGATNLQVQITALNTHFAQGTSVASFGAGITVTALTVINATTATATINIDESATIGPRNPTVTTGSEVASFVGGFTVIPGVSGITSIDPGGGPQGIQNLSLALTAQFTHFVQGTTTATFSGAGITLVSLTVNSPLTATLVVDVDATAATGPRDVTMTTGTEVVTAPGGFTVGSGTPKLLSATPNTGQQGQKNLPVTVTGQLTHFIQGTTTVTFGAGVTVASVAVSSPTTAVATLNFDSAAPLGLQTITVTSGAEVVSLNNGFSVLAGAPVLTSVSPNAGQQGQSGLSVTITGQNTHFSSSTTQVGFGAEISIIGLIVNSPTSVTASINIDNTASIGARAVTATTGAEIATLANSFTVQPFVAGPLSLNPPTGLQAQSLSVTITGTGTHFVQGTTQARFGPGISVGSSFAGDPGPVTVTSPTTATAQIMIVPTALPGSRTVTVQTGNEQESGGNAFVILGIPVVSSVAPNAGSQGTAGTVSINGNYTHFSQGTTAVALGAGITVTSVTVNSATSLIAAILIDAAAVPGNRTVAVQSGTEQVTAANGFTVLGPVTGPGPVPSITNPAGGSTITTPTTVTGTVVSPNLAYWTLAYQAPDGSVFTQFATGTSSTVTGTLDPTLLLNGSAVIQLTGVDASGQTAAVSEAIVIARNLKIGIFTVSFNDLTVPVGNLPIQIVRTYDTRRDGTSGDFGFGWTLDLKTITVATNIPLGQGWTATSSGGLFPTYCVQESSQHLITVSFADGTTYQFQPSLTSACQQLVPPSQVSFGFTPVTTTGTTPPNAGLALAITGPFDVVGSFPGPVSLFDENDVAVLDPEQFISTLPDGRIFQISRRNGLEKETDLNGNTLTVNPTGIISSTGKSVSFTRDGQSRITQITDPAGNTLNYAYDASGNLSTFADQLNNTSTYTYNLTHGLLTILDPRGVQPIRNDYDASGRLVSHTDAYGNVINYDHDTTDGQEIVTDRLGNITVNYYDSAGNIVQVVDAMGGITKRTYDANGNVLSETNALLETHTYTYDANNNRRAETDPLGQTTTYTYNARNQVLTITDPLGHVTTNTYDPNGNVLSTKDPAGNATTYIYEANGQQASVTDALGDVTSNQYDGSGNLTRQTDALGNITAYTYDGNGNRVSQAKTRTAASGVESLVTSYQYDSVNRLTQTTYPDGTNTQIQYNSIGKQSATIDQLGRQTGYQYDLMGRLVETDYPDQTSELSAYDAEGDRLSSTDRASRTTTYAYDPLKRLSRTVYPDTATTKTAYDAVSEVVGVTDPLGNLTQYGYDIAGRRTTVKNSLGEVTTSGFDADGNQTSMTDANGNTTQYQYDPDNRRINTIYADGTSEAITYDALGRTSAKTDQAGLITQFQYDKLGRLLQVADALNQVTKYTYDEIGDRITQTDANTHTTTFAYDKLGRRTMRTLPLGMSETSVYDAAGNLHAKTDFNGKTTTYAYDLSNRLTSKTPDASFSAAPISFTYTSTGQRLSMTDPSGATNYSYDLRDRLTRKATPEGTLSYTYDAGGNLLTMQSSNAGGTSVVYTYDALNRLAAVKDNRLASGTTTYSYDHAGNLQSYLYPNGVQTAYTYNTLNRLTNLAIGQGGSTLASYAYTLGPAGNRTQVTELGGRQVNYAYDSLYRLTLETIAGGTVNGAIGYLYDPVGNRLQRTSTVAPVPAASSTFDANDRLTRDSYDADGNTTVSGGNTYIYDYENHLMSQTGSSAVGIIYDGDGNRVAKTVAGTTTSYLVDDRNLTGYGQVVEELVNSGVLRVYTYGLHRISQSQASGTSFYGYDGHGNVRLLTDATGAVTDRYDYDAFGNIISQAGTTPNVYLYSGEQNDSNLGLYYLRARYLSPNTGRFWTTDKLLGNEEVPVSQHRYLYSGGDPVDNADPSGDQFLVPTIQFELSLSILSQIPVLAPSPSVFQHLKGLATRAEELELGSQLIYRLGPDRPKTVALRVQKDYVTGLSFTIEQPAQPHLTYNSAVLIAAGYTVTIDVPGTPVLDVRTQTPAAPPFAGTYPFNHATLYISDTNRWTKWYNDEQLQFGNPNYQPSGETLKLYGLREQGNGGTVQIE